MSHPNHVLFRMLAFLVLLAAASWPLIGGLQAAFFHNPALNGLVAGVFVVGILLSLRYVAILQPESLWLDSLQKQKGSDGLHPGSAFGGQSSVALRILSPLLPLLDADGRLKILPADRQQAILDAVAGRLDQQRELTRYFIGVMIFLGLLGTFWGLSHAVGSMGEVIRSLTMEGGDANAAFERLKAGMEAPLGGMGMAFSTSLFGLAGSLILGFLDLQCGQAHHSFYRRLEECLTAQTSSYSGQVSQTSANPTYITALLERTAERLDHLTVAAQANHRNNAALTEMITLLTEQLRANQAMVAQQSEMERQVHILLSRLIEETISSRDHLSEQIQAELRLLARTLTAPLEPEA